VFETKKKNRWNTEVKLPWSSRTAPPEEPDTEVEPGKAHWATALRIPWFHKRPKELETSVENAAEPVENAVEDGLQEPAPGKSSLWPFEMKWPWGNKGSDSQLAAAEPSAPLSDSGTGGTKMPFEDALLKSAAGKVPLLRFREKKSAAVAPVWNPRVLKFLEDHMAQHVGPVAKILVGRAAAQTDDVHALCQALVTQLASAQEQRSFLRAVAELMTHHKK
jgi:hypothetical protein